MMDGREAIRNALQEQHLHGRASMSDTMLPHTQVLHSRVRGAHILLCVKKEAPRRVAVQDGVRAEAARAS